MAAIHPNEIKPTLSLHDFFIFGYFLLWSVCPWRIAKWNGVIYAFRLPFGE
jgi:hypothetical protein